MMRASNLDVSRTGPASNNPVSPAGPRARDDLFLHRRVLRPADHLLPADLTLDQAKRLLRAQGEELSRLGQAASPPKPPVIPPITPTTPTPHGVGPVPVAPGPSTVEPLTPTTTTEVTETPTVAEPPSRRNGIHWALLHIIDVTGNKSRQIDLRRDVTDNTTLGFNLGLKHWLCDGGANPYLPSKLAKRYSDRHRPAHIWLESIMRVELGMRHDAEAGVTVAIPGVSPIGVGGAVNVGGQGIVRVLSACDLEGRNIRSVLGDHAPFVVPATRRRAEKMALGSEFELIAEARMAGMLKVTGGATAEVGKLKLGAGMEVATAINTKKLVSLKLVREEERVEVGEGRNKHTVTIPTVRVIVSDLSGVKNQLKAALSAGARYENELHIPIPWGDGAAKELLEGLTGLQQNSLNDYFARLASTEAGAVANASRTTTEMDSFVFRLRHPDGTIDAQSGRALDELVQSFSTTRAEALARAGYPGVTMADLDERESAFAVQAGFDAFARTMVARRVALANRSGELIGRDGKVVRYTVRRKDVHADNYFKDDRNIHWKLATVHREDELPSSSLTFRVARYDKEVEDEDVRGFLGLCAAAGVPGAEKKAYVVHDIPDLRGLFSSEDDVREAFEATIENEGLIRIDKARRREALAAYFQAAVLFEPGLTKRLPWLAEDSELRVQALELLVDYAQNVHRGPHCMCNLVSDAHAYLKMDAEDYAELMQDHGLDTRDIRQDYEALRSVLKGAEPFSRMVEKLRTRGGQDHRPLGPLFRTISRRRGRDMRLQMAALMLLAGPDQVTLHSATLRSKGANFEFDSEGSIDDGLLDVLIEEAIEGR